MRRRASRHVVTSRTFRENEGGGAAGRGESEALPGSRLFEGRKDLERMHVCT